MDCSQFSTANIFLFKKMSVLFSGRFISYKVVFDMTCYLQMYLKISLFVFLKMYAQCTAKVKVKDRWQLVTITKKYAMYN